MSAPWLTVIGVTEEGLEALSPRARAALDRAEQVIAPERFLAPLTARGKAASSWSPKLDNMLQQITDRRGQPTAILATGDPSWFGIGATLAGQLGPDEFSILPAPSAFSLAAARLKWPLQDVACISLHGRPVAMLVPHLQPGARVIALTAGAETVGKVAALLAGMGHGESRLTVLNRMGAPDESTISFHAADPLPGGIDEFNTLAIDCVAAPDAPLRPLVPGLPDEAFTHDGQLTKREVRAATLALLAPTPGALLWDIGAGCGSVAIEWMRAAPRARALAFEREPARREFILRNAEALGVPGLVVEGAATPTAFTGREAPQAIFLGGDVANEDLFDAAWTALVPGGRFVANAVTLDGEAALLARQMAKGGELVRISIERLDRVGDHAVLRPLMPVLQWAAIKLHRA